MRIVGPDGRCSTTELAESGHLHFAADEQREVFGYEGCKPHPLFRFRMIRLQRHEIVVIDELAGRLAAGIFSGRRGNPPVFNGAQS